MELKLSLNLIGPAEVNRLIREIKMLDDFFVGASARKTGTSMQPPRLTRLLDEVAKDNKANLLESDGRAELRNSLQQLLEKAPLLHISFAADPSPKALERILIWIRDSIDEHALLQVGIQPSIAAGCVLRTPNKIFDMSLRANLESQTPYLARLISGVAK